MAHPSRRRCPISACRGPVRRRRHDRTLQPLPSGPSELSARPHLATVIPLGEQQLDRQSHLRSRSTTRRTSSSRRTSARSAHHETAPASRANTNTTITTTISGRLRVLHGHQPPKPDDKPRNLRTPRRDLPPEPVEPVRRNRRQSLRAGADLPRHHSDQCFADDRTGRLARPWVRRPALRTARRATTGDLRNIAGYTVSGSQERCG